MLVSYLIMVARCPMTVGLRCRRRKHNRALVDRRRRNQRGNGVRRCAYVERHCRRAVVLLLEAGVVVVVAPVIVLVHEVLLLLVKRCRAVQHSLVSPNLHHLVI